MNYNSVPRRFNKSTSSINHAYIDSTLKNQQNTIDQNFGIMQQSVEAVLGADLIHEEDREMLKEKVSGVLNTLGNTDSINFGSTKARFSIQNALSEAARDPEVLKQVANTQRIRQFNKVISKAQEDGTYNPVNYEYARVKSGIDSYLAKGSERKKDLGNLSYISYYDYGKEAQEIFKDLSAQYKEKEVIVTDENGRQKVITTDSMTPQQMRMMVKQRLSSKALTQMGMEGASRYQFDSTRAQIDVLSKIEELELTKDKELKNLESQINDGMSPSEKEALQNKIKNTKSIYDQNLTYYNRLKGSSVEAIGSEVIKEGLMSTMITDNYRADYVSKIQSEKDYWGGVNEKTKAMQSITEAGQISSETGGPNRVPGNDMNNNSNPDITSRVGKVNLANNKTQKSILDIQYELLQEDKKSVSDGFQNMYSNLTAEEKTRLDTIEQDYKKELESRGIKLDDFTFNEQLFEKAMDNGVIPRNNSMAAKVATTRANIQAYSDKYNQDVKSFYDLKGAEAYEDIMKYDNVEVINEKGILVNLKNELTKLGVKDAKGFSDLMTTEKGKQLKANFIMGATLGNLSLRDPIYYYLNSTGKTESYMHVLHEPLKKMALAVKTLNGGNLLDEVQLTYKGNRIKDINEFTEIFKNNSGVNASLDIEIVPGKGMNFINMAIKQEGTLPNLIRQTPEDLSAIKNMFDLTGDEFNKHRKNLSQSDTVNMRGNNIITIEPSATGKNKVPAWEEIKNIPTLANPINPSYKGPVHLRKLSNNQIEIFTTDETYVAKDDKNTGDSSKQFNLISKGVISMDDIQNSQTRRYIDFNERDRTMQNMVKKQVGSYKPIYTSEYNQEVLFYEDMEGKLPQTQLRDYGNKRTKNGSISYMDNILKVASNNASLNKENIQEAKEFKNFYSEKYDQFRLRLTGTPDNMAMELVYINKGNKKENTSKTNNVVSRTVLPSNVNYDTFDKLFFNYPEVYMTELIGEALKSHVQGKNTKIKEIMTNESR